MPYIDDLFKTKRPYLSAAINIPTKKAEYHGITACCKVRFELKLPLHN